MLGITLVSIAMTMFIIAAWLERKQTMRILWITLAFINGILIFVGLSYR